MKKLHNIFKNSGIRDKINHNTLTVINIYKLGIAIGQYFTQIHQEPCSILIGTDTRPSGKWIKDSLAQGIKTSKHYVYDSGIVPTPCIAKNLKENKKFQLGIMITASHNPPEYNGLKFLTPSGYFTEHDELQISKLFHKMANPTISNHPSPIQKFDAALLYKQHVIEQLYHLPFQNITIVLDCAHGATYQLAEILFQKCGINTICINNSHDGTQININSGCNNPQLLFTQVQLHHADWGCAFDGDGDRIIIVDKYGKIYDGDDILLTLTQHPTLTNERVLIGTIMSNQGIENYLTSHHKKLLRTDVGERNLVEALQKNNAQLASENCGHITIAYHALCSDGIFAALLFFDTIQHISIPNYQKFHQLHCNILIENKSIKNEIIDKLLEEEKTHIQPGRAIIRKSNTEPLLRLTVEHEHKNFAHNIIQLLEQKLIQSLI